jgi:Kef-type K+ transport system membrane component KefB
LLSQPLRALAITAAASEDILSWVLLTVVVAFARSSSWAGSLFPLLGTTAWSFFLLFGLRPLRHRLQEVFCRSH